VLEPGGYGIFSLATVAALFGSWITGALAGTPLTVYLPALGRRAPRVILERMFASVATTLAVATAAVSAVLVAALSGDPLVVSGSAIYVGGWALREYHRNYAFARKAAQIAVLGDLVYASTASAGLLALHLTGATLVVGTVLLVVGAAGIVGALSVLVGLRAPVAPTFRWSIIRRYRRVWVDVRWSLAGVFLTFAQMHAHSLLVGTFAGPAAYAPLAAAQVLFAPVRIAVQAWQMVTRPDLAVAVAEGRWREIKRTSRVWMIIMALVGAFGAVVLASFWSPIHELLFEENYADAPMAMIAAISYTSVCVFAIGSVPSCTLQAFADFRPLAFATMIGAAVSTVGVMLILLVSTPAHSLLALLAAESVSTVIILNTMRRRLDTATQRDAPAQE